MIKKSEYIHEHYRDFGLINMNGRMYDPLVGRMLSPDIVIQNPEYSQSYNRYSYCFNNPLRFTDPSGYVVRGRNDVLNPQYFIWLKSSNSKNGNSFNTDIVEGSPMMMEDNYTVDEQGYIKLVEKTNMILICYIQKPAGTVEKKMILSNSTKGFWIR